MAHEVQVFCLQLPCPVVFVSNVFVIPPIQVAAAGCEVSTASMRGHPLETHGSLSIGGRTHSHFADPRNRAEDSGDDRHGDHQTPCGESKQRPPHGRLSGAMKDLRNLELSSSRRSPIQIESIELKSENFRIIYARKKAILLCSSGSVDGRCLQRNAGTLRSTSMTIHVLPSARPKRSSQVGSAFHWPVSASTSQAVMTTGTASRAIGDQKRK